METMQTSTSRRTKCGTSISWNIVSNKKGWTINTSNNVRESQNNHTEWKKSVKKSTKKIPLIQNYRKYKVMYSDRKEIEEGWNDALQGLTRGERKFGGVTDLLTTLIVAMVSWVYTYVQTLQSTNLNYVWFVICWYKYVAADLKTKRKHLGTWWLHPSVCSCGI